MRTASIQEIKQEMSTIKPAELSELCLRLAKFKKENKELLTYLLFESHDEAGYILSVKKEIDEHFETINLSHLYFVKKSLRKILRIIGRHVRYMSSKTAEVELLLYFCTRISDSGIPYEKSQMISNLYNAQLKKLKSLIGTLHEDLQYDYLKEYELLA